MDWEEFKEKIDNENFSEIESKIKKGLQTETEEEKINLLKYQLGICYTYIDDKLEQAKDIFKELILFQYNYPYMYLYLAESTSNTNKAEEYLEAGLSLFPQNTALNKLRIYTVSEERKILESYEILEKNNSLSNCEHLKISSMYFEKADFTSAQKYINKIEISKIKDIYDRNQLAVLQMIISVLNNKDIDVQEIRKYIIGDFDEQYGNLARYIEIAHYINKKDYKKIDKAIDLLDYDCVIDYLFEIFRLYQYGPIYFIVEKFIKDLKEMLLELNISDRSKNKLKCIDIITKHLENEEQKYTKKQMKENIEIIKNELSINSYNRSLYEMLFEFLMLLDKEKEAIEVLFEGCIDNHFEDKLWYISHCKFKKETIKYLGEKVANISVYKIKDKKTKELLNFTINSLYRNKNYEEICRLEEKYKEHVDFDDDIIFKIAYSYADIESNEQAIKYYELLLSKEQDNSAVLNNLGVIYKQQGNVDKALELFKKSEDISHNDIHISNIEDCYQIKKELKKNEEEIKSGEYNIEKENGYIIEKLFKFISKANENNDIICSHNELQYVLGTRAEKANEVLKTFLDKKYIFRLNSHNYNTSKSVYKINQKVVDIINRNKEENELFNIIIDKIGNLTINNISEMNLSQKIEKIKEIKDAELYKIINRDYIELYESYLLKNNKSVIILSGSIIEALLIQIIKNNETPSNDIYEKNITELLNICENNNYISKIPINLISGLKRYRNFVHPGVEIREKNKKIEINDEAANIMWDFVNWLIDYAI